MAATTETSKADNPGKPVTTSNGRKEADALMAIKAVAATGHNARKATGHNNLNRRRATGHSSKRKVANNVTSSKATAKVVTVTVAKVVVATGLNGHRKVRHLNKAKLA